MCALPFVVTLLCQTQETLVSGFGSDSSYQYTLQAESPSIFLDQLGRGRRLCERHFLLSMG